MPMALEVTVLTTGTIRTMDALRGIGFLTDNTVMSDDGPGLSFDFGGLKLRAGAYTKLLAEMVMITGVLSTPRRLAQIHFELPRYDESANFVKAWIVWHLDQHQEFKKAYHMPWLEDGRENQSLLPWIKSIAEWNARPKLIVRRDWLRLALNRLAEHLSTLTDQSKIIFSFDGSVFSIRCDQELIALAAEGTRWTVSFGVHAGDLRRLPRRLMHEHVSVSIWESRIRVGSQSYPGTVQGFGVIYRSKVQ
jgi:hypothetical protein